MTLVPRSRRRRRLSRAARAIRSAVMVKALVAAARRRRGLGLALRGTPIGVLIAFVGLIVAVVRRRRRRRLEAELGPPNQSAPGDRVGPGAGTRAPAGSVPAGPNEGAPGHAPEADSAERAS